MSTIVTSGYHMIIFAGKTHDLVKRRKDAWLKKREGEVRVVSTKYRRGEQGRTEIILGIEVLAPVDVSTAEGAPFKFRPEP